MIPKFRAWKKAGKELGRVGQITFELDGSVSCVLFKGKFLDFNVPINEIVLMQSTGLKDKNGKEIFEGDVVSRNSGMPSVVEFGKWIYEEDFGYKIKNIGFYLNSSYDDDEFFQAMDYEDIRKNYEVIGNIYENPELLEDKE